MQILTPYGPRAVADLAAGEQVLAPLEWGDDGPQCGPVVLRPATPRTRDSVVILGVLLPADAGLATTGGTWVRADAIRAGDAILAWGEDGQPRPLILETSPEAGEPIEWPGFAGDAMFRVDGYTLAGRF